MTAHADDMVLVPRAELDALRAENRRLRREAGDREALRRIRHLGPRLASQQRPRVRRVLTSLPASDVMEMAVVVGFGPRVRALAVRLERSAACPSSERGAPSGRAGPSGRIGPSGCAKAPGHGEPTDRWVCTAVEAA